MYARYAENLSPQIYRDLYGDAMLVPIRMGSNMAAGNQQKHLSLSFAAYLSIEKVKNNIIMLFANTRTVQIAKFPEISHFLNNSASHVNAASRKSLAIQA